MHHSAPMESETLASQTGGQESYYSRGGVVVDGGVVVNGGVVVDGCWFLIAFMISANYQSASTLFFSIVSCNKAHCAAIDCRLVDLVLFQIRLHIGYLRHRESTVPHRWQD
ncbi:hypothetical protein Tco_1366155 [Tanacetum coccineum]